MSNTEIFIIDEKGIIITQPRKQGQLVVRGNNVMLGYWNNPTETEKILKDGFYPLEKVLFTGDIFEFDEEGDLFFISRIDDILKVKGEKVSLLEIEKILYMIPEVDHVEIIHKEDKLKGNIIAALLTVKNDCSEKKIRIILEKYLSKTSIPDYIIFIENIPLNENKKTDKNELKIILDKHINERRRFY